MNTIHKASVLIVDDHPLIRQGIKRIIDMEDDMVVCCEASSADEAISQLSKGEHDIVIVDITLDGGVSGIDLIKAIRKRYKDIKTLVLSMHSETIYVERALRSGAQGYITKKDAPQSIVEAIRTILKGEVYVCKNLSGKVINKLIHGYGEDAGMPIDNLSDREYEIFELIGSGYGTSEIAQRLNLSANTVESHRKKIKEKLGIQTGHELIKNAVQWLLSQEREK
jgi:DNA-binding NarL/FixJ family response regulator